MGITIWEIIREVDWIKSLIKKNPELTELVEDIRYKLLMLITSKESRHIHESNDWIHIDKKWEISIETMLSIRELVNSEFFKVSIIEKFKSFLLWNDKIYFNLIINQYIWDIDFWSKPEKMKSILTIAKTLSVENSPLFHLVGRLLEWEEVISSMIKVLWDFNYDIYENPFDKLPKKVWKFLNGYNNKVDLLLRDKWHTKNIVH